jgi:PAS domain S-box-containing protein
LGRANVESILFRRVEKALHESQELTRDILDSAFDAIISMDEDGRIINWNKHAETLFGWSASETIEKILSDIIIPPRFRESHEKGLERFLATGKSKVINQQIEIFAMHKDGYEFPVEISISATSWEDSFIFNGIIRDTSLREQAGEQAKRKTEKYEVMHETAKVLPGEKPLDTMLQMAMKIIGGSKAFNFESDAGIFCQENIFGKDGNSGEWSLNNFCLLNPGQPNNLHEKAAPSFLNCSHVMRHWSSNRQIKESRN